MKAVRLVPERFQDIRQCALELFHVIGNEVRQVSVLRLIPYIFNGIKLGSVCRKPLDAQPIQALGQ